jgi:isoleucyl-tRNA synthetase
LADQANHLDRWARNETRRVAKEVDAALEDYDAARAGRAIAGLIDDLSNWYVRRSRRRFWDGDPAALATLHECLQRLTLLMAPFTPFVTERVWRALFASTTGIESVHLAPWPQVNDDVDTQLSEQVALVRRLVELGRAARAEAKVKTRQPLARALVSAPGWAALPESLKKEITDELNVRELAGLADAGDLVDISVKPNFRALGKRFGSGTKGVAQAISSADATSLAAAVRTSGTATVRVDGEPLDVSIDELIISEAPRSGWAVGREGSETIALDLELTPELRRLGFLREVIRGVQEARKNAGLDVTDRIELRWQVGGAPAPGEAIRAHADELSAEVLATTLLEGAPEQPGEYHEVDDEDLGLRIWLRRA